MSARTIGDLGLVLYLLITSVPLLMFVIGIAVGSGNPEAPPVLSFVPMGCVLFFVPAHLAACTLLWIDLLQRRRLDGLLWAPALLLGAWLTVPFYYWFRVRPHLSTSRRTDAQPSQPAA